MKMIVIAGGSQNIIVDMRNSTLYAQIYRLLNVLQSSCKETHRLIR